MPDLMDYALVEDIEEIMEVEETPDGWVASALGEKSEPCATEEEAIEALESYISDYYSWQQIVVALYEDYNLSDMNTSSWGDESRIYCGHREWLVLTDEEADEETHQRIVGYIDDIVFSEIPGTYHRYFDLEKFVDDNNSDRGSWLSSYDGEENEYQLGMELVFIYRQ